MFDSGRLASNTAGVSSDLRRSSKMTYFEYASRMGKKKKDLKLVFNFFALSVYTDRYVRALLP